MYLLPCFLTLISLHLPSTQAATCFGTPGHDPQNSISSAWSLRSAACGHNACAASNAEQGNNKHCVISMPFASTGEVQIQLNDPSGKYKNCYAATANIISQCFNAPSSPFDPHSDPNGFWRQGEEWYWITMNYTMPAPETEGDNEESDGRITDGTLMGPSRICQGFSPGGGESCIEIPVGCYVDVPVDNTVAEVKCDV